MPSPALAVVAIVIVVLVAAVARAARDLITNALSGLSYGPLLGTLAAVFIWGLGVIAALNQIGVATSVTTPVLITVLATIGGIPTRPRGRGSDLLDGGADDADGGEHAADATTAGTALSV